MIRRGTIGVAMSWECGWLSDAPAFSPWFLKIRMYLNRLSLIRSRYRCLYAMMTSLTWKSLSSGRGVSWSGVSTMTSWAPTPFTEWNSWLTWRRTSPSTDRAGYLFGTQRIHQPAEFAAPSFRYARISGGVMCSWPMQNGHFSGGVGRDSNLNSPGRFERTVEKTTHVSVT